MTRRRVAVVGSGVAGLTAAYVLRRSHEVTLYEADDRLGGHAHTHDVRTPSGQRLAVDTGFIVHNERTYPILLRLFAELGVRTRDTDMSMSVSCAGCGLEYSGGQGVRGIVPAPATLARPAFLRLLADVPRFHRRARRLLDGTGDDDPDLTLAAFLAAGGWSPYTVAHFVTPLVAAVWSCEPATAARYPARYLFRFLDNHGMLRVTGSPRWRTVEGGSRTYVERAVKELTAVRLSTPVRAVTRTGDGVEVRDAADRVRRYDGVVVATHPDQALDLLAEATAAEGAALGAFSYTPNPAVLHTDASVLPRTPHARASWNYRMGSCAGDASAVRVSYDMTRLQRLPEDGPRYLVSLNAPEIDERRVIARMAYAHPRFVPGSVAAQASLPALNDGVVAFAGAYHGWGFHEDGARAGLAAAESLGGRW